MLFAKQLLVGLAQRKAGLTLTETERQLACQMGAGQPFGWEQVSQATGLGQKAARRLVEDWDRRGLAAKCARPGGGRYLTDEGLKKAQ